MRLRWHPTFVMLLTLAGRSAQSPFERAEVTIPMRDGTRLFAVTLTPRLPRSPLTQLLLGGD